MKFPTKKYLNHNIYTYKTKSGQCLFSSNVVLLNEWLIKASISNLDSIMILLQNINSNEIKIKFFKDELEANKFICSHTNR